MAMRSESAWSFLDSRPICIYDEKYHAHLAFWNGVGMTRTYAIIIYGMTWLNLFPSLSQREEAFAEYNRIYRSNGFGTRDWDSQLRDMNSYTFPNYLMKLICRNDISFLQELSKKYDQKTALSWFMPMNEIKI